jgi:hypothetical protein
MITIGFTGTRKGVTKVQHDVLREELLTGFGAEIQAAHHGDCVGADADFDAICAELGVHRTAWPGYNAYHQWPNRAFCKADQVMTIKPYKTRDRLIVLKGVDGLIACPGGMKEELRSGTWMTVRMARNMLRTIHIIYPDGSIQREADGRKIR